MSDEKKERPSKKAGNLHKDHRDRVRDRFLRDGLEGLEDHVKLELLLYYAIPQRDTNPLAHQLLEQFDSLSSVFDASLEELMKVKGMGKSSAVLLKMVPQLARVYLADKEKNSTRLYNKEAVINYVKQKFIGRSSEALAVVALDSQSRVRYCEIVHEGDTDMVPVHIKQILGIAIRCNATSIIIAHNHPSGIAVPSPGDLDVTARLYRALQEINVELQDHILVVENGTLSFRDTGLMDNLLYSYGAESAEPGPEESFL